MSEKKPKHFDELYTEKYHILAEKVLGEVTTEQQNKGISPLDGILHNTARSSQLDYLPLFRKKLEESLEMAIEIFTQIGLTPPTMSSLKSLPNINWQGFAEVHDYFETEKQKPVVLFVPQAAIEISEWDEMFRSVVPQSTISRFTLGVDTKTINPTFGSPSMYRKSGICIDGEDLGRWQCIVMPTKWQSGVAIRDLRPMLLPTIPEYLTAQLYGFASSPKKWQLLGRTLLRTEMNVGSVIIGHAAAFSISISREPKVIANTTTGNTYQVWSLKNM